MLHKRKSPADVPGFFVYGCFFLNQTKNGIENGRKVEGLIYSRPLQVLQLCTHRYA